MPTPQSTRISASRPGRHAADFGRRNPTFLTPAQVGEIRSRSAAGDSGRALARAYRCSPPTIRRVLAGELGGHPSA